MTTWIFLALALVAGSVMLQRRAIARAHVATDAEKALNTANFLLACGQRQDALEVLEEAALIHGNDQAIREKLDGLRRDPG